MAQLLAPYNNSMRLGQGFNSYTQQICLDRAVLPGPKNKRAQPAKAITLSRKKPTPAPSQPTGTSEQASDDVKSIDSVPDESSEEPRDTPASTTILAEGAKTTTTTTAPKAAGDADAPDEKPEAETFTVNPWVKPQIVTYSSRFVDKLSDVTDAMNISGSLSIKTATIGGKASGSYVDSDKFKSSDINFHLQVKVTNQLHDAEDYNVFNKIDSVDAARFPEVYGDSFISGWEEGGELNAILSIKVLDKSKIFQIKASVEAELTTPAIAGKVEAKVDMQKDSLNKETETTLAVNWSGGGSIKNAGEDWTIETLKMAAAAFPDLVAVTPQRTYAILTRYTALESFHRQQTNFKPLDYENAGIYTGALLDAYMDYKALWKQISNATYELEGNRATIDMGEPSEEIVHLAKVRPFPLVDKNSKFKQITDGKPAEEDTADEQRLALSVGQQRKQQLKPLDESDLKKIQVFQPSFAGLIEARKMCRFEMSKIVREVDLVANDPSLAVDPRRDSFFLHPLVFKQLLPVVRSLSPENALLGVRDPAAALLLGYSQPTTEDRALPPVYNLAAEIQAHAVRLRESIEGVAHRAHDYRMQGCVGPISDTEVHSRAKLFNDLVKLDQTYRPSEISVWGKDERVSGIKMQYANGEKKLHGNCEGAPSHTLALAHNGSEAIVEIVVKEVVDSAGLSWISSLSVATSACNVLETDVTGDEPATSKDAAASTDGTQKMNASSTPTTNDQPASKEKPTKKDEPIKKDESTKTDAPSKIVKIKTTTWTKPDDPRYSLRGFFGFTHNSSICTLGAIWGKDSFVPVPTSRIVPSLCRNFLGLSKNLQSNIRGHKAFAGKFFMGSSVSTNAVGTSGFFNAMDVIDVNWQIKAIGFASDKGMLSGLKVFYHNGRELVHGVYTKETERWVCDVKSELAIVKITAGKLKVDGPAYIDTVEFVRGDQQGVLPAWPLHLATLRFLGEGDVRVSKDVSEVVEPAPKMGNVNWSVRGFYGECTGGFISRLGVIWGRG